MERERTHIGYLVLYIAALTTAVIWLILGLLPALAAASETLHDRLHAIGASGNWFGAGIATNAAHASHNVSSGGQIALDYAFSVFTLTLSVVVMRLRPRDRTANLLALGMVGSAVAFNLQGHVALQVVPVSWLVWVSPWHEVVHIMSGLAYVFALLSFPDGTILRGPSVRYIRPFVLVVAVLFFMLLSEITVEDHTVGLVIVFGLFIPITGFLAQIGRYRRARNEEERQRSRVLLWALGAALLVVVPLMYVTGATDKNKGSATFEYEVALAPGNYFFRCDPHPDTMTGIVHVADDGPNVVALGATDSEFDVEEFSIGSGDGSTIRFTNNDTDVHNVAIYRTAEMSGPVYVGALFSGSPSGIVAFRFFRLVFAFIPVALIVGLARSHLWDINRVVNRALAYALLAGFVTLVYLALVLGIGAVAGSTGRLSVGVSIALTVIVAASFQPLRDRATRLANRIVYGKRATPYEVLSEFSNRVGAAPDLETVIPQLARMVGDATGAASAEVWLRNERRLARSGVWPEDDVAESVPDLFVANGKLPDIPGRDAVVPVRHLDELLGALSVTKPPGEHLTPVEERLLADAASQAGLALKNVQLTAELQTRLAELRSSRQRIVSAQDAERRRLERDIHDGAQQNLLALSMKLRVAQQLALSDPEKAAAMLEELQTDTGEALSSLRDLARGIHPPVLTDHGLEAALEAHARRCPLPVSVRAFGIGRYTADIEATVYFCCSEAIQNAVKHSGATAVIVDIREGNDALWFTIADDGAGFEPSAVGASGLTNVSDRLAAVAGGVEISSTPGRGTVVSGRVPLP